MKTVDSPDAVYKLVALGKSSTMLDKGVWYTGAKGIVVILPSTFGVANVPPMSLKAGKDVRLVNLRPLSFLS